MSSTKKDSSARCAVACGSARGANWLKTVAKQIIEIEKLKRERDEVRGIAVAALRQARQIKPSYESRCAAIDLALEKLSLLCS